MRVFEWKTHMRNESEGRLVLLRQESAFRRGGTIDRSVTCERFEYEHICWDPKDGDLCLNRVKPGETLVEARSDTDVQIVRLIQVQGRKTNRTIQQLVPSEVSLRIAGTYTVLSGKANDQRSQS